MAAKDILKFFVIYLLIQISISSAIDIKISPTTATIGKTETFVIEINSSKDLNKVILEFFVDGSKKGAKSLLNIKKGEPNFIYFDCFFGRDSYLGEHYIEICANYTMETNIEKSMFNYYSIMLRGNQMPLWAIIFNLSPILLFLYIIYKTINSKSIIVFSADDRKMIFNILITILPISVSFSIFILDRPELKIFGLLVILNFLISYFTVIYSYFKDKSNSVYANNSILLSLSLFIYGLFNLIFAIYEST